MPGFISWKGYFADDGERVSVHEWESAEALEAWRTHPEHLRVQELGRERRCGRAWSAKSESTRPSVERPSLSDKLLSYDPVERKRGVKESDLMSVAPESESQQENPQETPLGQTVTDVLVFLKSKARRLHKQIEKGEPVQVARMRALPKMASFTDQELIGQVKRRLCLNVIAMELGFRTWASLAHVMEGDEVGGDFGTILCPERMMAHQNIWLADYEEARDIHADHGGFLLGYRRQFFIADADYLMDLGLDPEREEWAKMDRNWVEPGDLNARARLYARLFAERLPA
eukprot:s1_g1754.t1